MEELKRMPVDELEQTQEYQKLTPKQRLFVATYCAGGLLNGNYDAVEATRVAYQCKSVEVARIMSYSMLANIRIIEALNRHFRTEPIQDFIRVLDRAIRNRNLTLAQMQALKLKCDILGFTNRLPTALSAIPGTIKELQTEAQAKARAERKANKKPRAEKPEIVPELSEYDKEAARF